MRLNFQRLVMHENFQYRYCNFQADFFLQCRVRVRRFPRLSVIATGSLRARWKKQIGIEKRVETYYYYYYYYYCLALEIFLSWKENCSRFLCQDD